MSLFVAAPRVLFSNMRTALRVHLKQTIISTVNQRTKAAVSGIVALDF